MRIRSGKVHFRSPVGAGWQAGVGEGRGRWSGGRDHIRDSGSFRPVVALPERRFRWRQQQRLWWFRVSLSPRCRGPGPQVGWGASRRPPAPLLLPRQRSWEGRAAKMHGAREGPSPLTLQVLSPWQRPRPWGRAGGGETARLSPPTVAWPRPGLGDSVPVAAEARAKGRGTREREGGRAPRFAVGRATHLPSHQPGRGTTGRASGERDHTISSPAAASSIFPGLEWTFWRMYLNE